MQTRRCSKVLLHKKLQAVHLAFDPHRVIAMLPKNLLRNGFLHTNVISVIPIYAKIKKSREFRYSLRKKDYESLT